MQMMPLTVGLTPDCTTVDGGNNATGNTASLTGADLLPHWAIQKVKNFPPKPEKPPYNTSEEKIPAQPGTDGEDADGER
jgi:hypothetical protein